MTGYADSGLRNGYRTVTLGEVLTGDELAAQPFAGDMVLNHVSQVPETLGRCFAQMARDEQRAYVKRAIELAQLGRSEPVATLAVLLALAYAPPPRLP